MVNFTPVSSFVGGMLIGVSTSLLLMFNGKIAGASGILGGVLWPKRGDLAWRVLFLAGVVGGGAVFLFARPGAILALPGQTVPVALLGGLLVGVGTHLGSGCTSGHGVCGMSRLSRRSIAATLIFNLSGALTVYVMRHLLGS